MKRYIVLLALIGVQVNVTLPNGMWESFKSKASSVIGYFRANTAKSIEEKESFQEKWKREFEPKEEAIQDSFGKKFDVLVGDNLDEQQRKDALLVRNMCSGHLLRFLNAKPEFINKKDILEHEGGLCVANVAQKQSGHKFKENIDLHPQPRIRTWTSEYRQAYKKTKQEFGQKARYEFLDKYKSGTPGNLAYLFKEPLGGKVIGKVVAMNDLYLWWLDWFRREKRLGRVPIQGLSRH